MNEQKINRGTHGDSLLILVSLETLSKKPPLQAWNAKWWEHVTAERKKCRMEIIEIGAVMIDENYNEISSFKRYVKPEFSSKISTLITELTGITDSMLMGKSGITDELLSFAEWCCSCGDDFKVFAWSESDLKQVTGEMQQKNIIETESLRKVLDRWGDLQLEFDSSLCSARQTSLSNALESLGLAFEGHMHDALDDARNTARLFSEMSTSDDYKKDVEYIKNCFYDENRGSGVTLGDLFDFSKLNFEF